jgi:hypothetical protein
VPDGVAFHDTAVGVFLEIPQKVALKFSKFPAQSDQGSLKAITGIRETSESEA